MLFVAIAGFLSIQIAIKASSCKAAFRQGFQWGCVLGFVTAVIGYWLMPELSELEPEILSIVVAVETLFKGLLVGVLSAIVRNTSAFQTSESPLPANLNS